MLQSKRQVLAEINETERLITIYLDTDKVVADKLISNYKELNKVLKGLNDWESDFRLVQLKVLNG